MCLREQPKSYFGSVEHHSLLCRICDFKFSCRRNKFLTSELSSHSSVFIEVLCVTSNRPTLVLHMNSSESRTSWFFAIRWGCTTISPYLTYSYHENAFEKHQFRLMLDPRCQKYYFPNFVGAGVALGCAWKPKTSTFAMKISPGIRNV